MSQSPLIIAPSILAGDFGHLAQEAKRAELAGADWLHLDVMDGHFVPNLTMGPKAVAAINKATNLFLDVHLMIYNPYDYIEAFVQAGADSITIHLEATEDVEDTLNFIKRCGINACLAINPETEASLVIKYLDICDMVLLMTVDPGFGGQAFMPKVIEKVAFIHQVQSRVKRAKPLLIEVDGGIDDKTAPLCVKEGASVLVAGTYLFKALDMQTAIKKLKAS